LWGLGDLQRSWCSLLRRIGPSIAELWKSVVGCEGCSRMKEIPWSLERTEGPYYSTVAFLQSGIVSGYSCVVLVKLQLLGSQ